MATHVQQHLLRPLDARALGDLSAFPALCKLAFHYCEVMLCESVLGAVRHSSLASMSFHMAHPAPDCVRMVLKLCQELRQRGMLDLTDDSPAQALPPFHKFKAALELCAL